jgi:hypothetical protein
VGALDEALNSLARIDLLDADDVVGFGRMCHVIVDQAILAPRARACGYERASFLADVPQPLERSRRAFALATRKYAQVLENGSGANSSQSRT